ncbi:MAG: hypothetical protein ACE5ER_08310 [Nitrospinaceae bacterium]
MSVGRLLTDIKKHLPLRVYGNGAVMELLREMGRQVDKKTPLTATGVFREAESGEIICELTLEGKEKITAALSNLKVDISHSLYRQVKNYRNEVADAISGPETPGINSQSFRLGSLYKKK